ncbi:hypothetical protein GGQ64_003330 [Rhizobium azooxidifex]|uniref:Uncharacterized protein n=1 Tax=Mycoplana azooxidifex TaxID=1636188 RepID=A0A7W6DBD9_9HYPH|nr:hypothetical protein [Mycoplana azooxidifex]
MAAVLPPGPPHPTLRATFSPPGRRGNRLRPFFPKHPLNPQDGDFVPSHSGKLPLLSIGEKVAAGRMRGAFLHQFDKEASA